MNAIQSSRAVLFLACISAVVWLSTGLVFGTESPEGSSANLGQSPGQFTSDEADSNLRPGLPQPPPKDEPGAEAPEDGLVLTGEPVLMPAICVGSWCADGAKVINPDEPVEVAGITMTLDSRNLTIRGFIRQSRPNTRIEPYRPHSFRLPAEPEAEPPETRVRVRALARGTNIELCAADGNGFAVIRIEQNWRGIVWGPISGWEFELEREKLYVVDADLDGRLSPQDRMVYGDRTIWMPFHTVTASGDTIYHEISIANSRQLTARRQPMAPRGVDSRVWDEWQEERKNQGIPPGLFCPQRQADCVSHAEYLRINQKRTHSQDRNNPGYSAAGHRAGMSSCIAIGNRTTAMRVFLDSLYHRPQLINPRDVGLIIGGNNYAFLMGFGLGEGLPSENRDMEQAQLHPAPNTVSPNGLYPDEHPLHPILRETNRAGMPVIARASSVSTQFTDIDCRLYTVRGDLSSGTRDSEIRCHLSHSGKDAPEDFANMWGMVALTPYAPLTSGVYQAEFNFKANGREHSYIWRFQIGR